MNIELRWNTICENETHLCYSIEWLYKNSDNFKNDIDACLCEYNVENNSNYVFKDIIDAYHGKIPDTLQDANKLFNAFCAVLGTHEAEKKEFILLFQNFWFTYTFQVENILGEIEPEIRSHFSWTDIDLVLANHIEKVIKNFVERVRNNLFLCLQAEVIKTDSIISLDLDNVTLSMADESLVDATDTVVWVEEDTVVWVEEDTVVWVEEDMTLVGWTNEKLINYISSFSLEEQQAYFDDIYKIVLRTQNVWNKRSRNSVLAFYFKSEDRSEGSYAQKFHHLFWWNLNKVKASFLKKDKLMIWKIINILWFFKQETLWENNEAVEWDQAKSQNELDQSSSDENYSMQVEKKYPELGTSSEHEEWGNKVKINGISELTRLKEFVDHLQKQIDHEWEEKVWGYERKRVDYELSVWHFDIAIGPVWIYIFELMTDWVKKSQRLRNIFSLINLEECEQIAAEYFWNSESLEASNIEPTKVTEDIMQIDFQEETKELKWFITFSQEKINGLLREKDIKFDRKKHELSTQHFNIVGKKVWANIFSNMTAEVRDSKRITSIAKLFSWWLEDLVKLAFEYFNESYDPLVYEFLLTREIIEWIHL